MLQQSAGFGDPQVHVIALGRRPQLLFEQTLDLPARPAGVETEGVHLQRLFQVRVHQIDHFPQRATNRHIERGFDAPVTRSFKRQNVFDAISQRFVVQALDPLQRHIKRAVWAGRRQTVAIDNIGFAGDLGQFGDFRQRGTVFRVNRATIAVEQTSSPEEPGAIPHASQLDAQFGGTDQETDQRIVGLEGRAVTTANNQQVQVLNRGLTEAGIGTNDQAQIADHFPFSQTEGLRGKQLRPQQIGGDDRIECLGKRRQREMLQQQEACPGLY
ncbi:hypothetical protein D3C87_1330400 [compost metagenome]